MRRWFHALKNLLGGCTLGLIIGLLLAFFVEAGVMLWPYTSSLAVGCPSAARSQDTVPKMPYSWKNGSSLKRDISAPTAALR